MEQQVIIDNGGIKLFGILHIPEERLLHKVCIIFLNRMEEYRIGPHRIFVDAARKFTSFGFYCIRFDPRGEGDSSDSNTTRFSDVLYDSLAIKEYLIQSLGFEKIIYFGMCRGARIAINLNIIDHHMHDCILLSSPPDVSFLSHSYLKFLLRNRNMPKNITIIVGIISFIFINSVVIFKYTGLKLMKYLNKRNNKDRNRNSSRGNVLMLYGNLDQKAGKNISYYSLIYDHFKINYKIQMIKNTNSVFSSYRDKNEIINIILKWLINLFNPANRQKPCMINTGQRNCFSSYSLIKENDYSYETSFRISSNGKNLFGVYNKAKEPKNKNQPIVFICAPVLEEHIYSYSVSAKIARELSLYGFDVVRFDYGGIGESSGDFFEISVESMIGDIKNVCKFFYDKNRNITLLGIRIGGTLSKLVYDRELYINNLILWEPVVNGRSYIKKLFLKQRLNELKKSRSAGKKSTHMFSSKNGKAIDIDGYRIGMDFTTSIQEIDLLEGRTRKEGNVLIHQLVDDKIVSSQLNLLNKNYDNGIVKQTFCIPFWQRWYSKMNYNYSKLFKTTIDWIIENT